jgi:hypothetical protein
MKKAEETWLKFSRYDAMEQHCKEFAEWIWDNDYQPIYEDDGNGKFFISLERDEGYTIDELYRKFNKG